MPTIEDTLRAHNRALATKNLELLEIVQALAAEINVLALISADDFYKPGDYAAGLVNDAWITKNRITANVLFGDVSGLPKA